MAGDAEDAAVEEEADTENAGSNIVETEVAKGGESQEDAEVAAAKGQEVENESTMEQLVASEGSPKMHEVEEESNATLSSGDAEPDEDNDETMGNEVQGDKQAVDKTILASKGGPVLQKGDYHRDKVRGPGDTLSLDNSGFEALTKLKDTKQEGVYIQRVLHEQGFVVSNATGFLLFSSLCSNGHGPRSFDLLSEDILKVVTQPHGWAGILRNKSSEASNPAFGALTKPSNGTGLTSPLNQEGYRAVLQLKSGTEMSVFIHRVINHLSLDVNDRWGLMGIIPFYDGTKSEQSYATLTTEILNTALQPGKWVSVGPEMA